MTHDAQCERSGPDDLCGCTQRRADANCSHTQSSQIVPSEDNPLYSVGTVAKMFDVSDYTVRTWIREKKITGIKVMGQWKIQKSECIRVANKEYGK